MELAEEARNVRVESGRSYYTEEVQSQGAGLTKPVFVTVVENSSPVLRKGATIAAGISTEMIPTNRSAGRREPVDQLGLVGPQDKTGQSALPGSDADEVGTVPTGPVGPDVTVDQIQPVAAGPVGQYITRRPVGPDRMFSILNRTASEVMHTVYAREPFPTDAVHFVTPGRRVRRAAHYMAAMGLWRPTSAPIFPGTISVSSGNSCMACEDCFPDAPQ